MSNFFFKYKYGSALYQRCKICQLLLDNKQMQGSTKYVHEQFTINLLPFQMCMNYLSLSVKINKIF